MSNLDRLIAEARDAKVDPPLPEEIFSPKEISKIEKIATVLGDPEIGGKWLLWQFFWGFLGVFGFGIVLGQIHRLTNTLPDQLPGTIWLFPFFYGFGRLWWINLTASTFFNNVDREYFKRAGITRREYERVCLRWTYENAQIIFSAPEFLPSNPGIHKKRVDKFISDALRYESTLSYKAYVGRQYGMKPPLKKRREL